MTPFLRRSTRHHTSFAHGSPSWRWWVCVYVVCCVYGVTFIHCSPMMTQDISLASLSIRVSQVAALFAGVIKDHELWDLAVSKIKSSCVSSLQLQRSLVLHSALREFINTQHYKRHKLNENPSLSKYVAMYLRMLTFCIHYSCVCAG